MSRFMLQGRGRAGQCGSTLSAVVAGLILAANCAVADDVVLVAGTTFKQASGGRVRGQVQSESPTEVVVKLGNHHNHCPDRPDPLDPL